MNTSTFLNLRLAAAAGVLALAGCGGGGGSSPPRVDVGTAERVGTASANSDVSQANFPDWSSRLARLVASTASSSLAGGTAGSRESPAGLRIAQRASAMVLSATSRKQIAATAPPDTQPCAGGGSVTVVATDANNNGVVDNGDSIEIISNNCVAATGEPAVNGGMRLVVNIAETSGNVLVALDASGSVDQLSVAGVVTLQGNFRFKIRSETNQYDRFRFSYEALTSTTPTETVTYNFDLYGLSPAVTTVGEQVAFQGSITIGVDTYRLSQPSTDIFVTAPGADLPQSGSLAILDAAGDRLVLTAKPGRLVDVVFYSAAAPTTPVVSLLDQDWNTLAFGP